MLNSSTDMKIHFAIGLQQFMRACSYRIEQYLNKYIDFVTGLYFYFKITKFAMQMISLFRVDVAFLSAILKLVKEPFCNSIYFKLRAFLYLATLCYLILIIQDLLSYILT